MVESASLWRIAGTAVGCPLIAVWRHVIHQDMSWQRVSLLLAPQYGMEVLNREPAVK